MGIIQIGTQPQITELLAKADGVHLFIATDGVAAITRIKIVGHGHKVTFGEAITRKRHLAACFLEVFRIVDAV
ncbi:Uncharacterised protein [Yersinia enterocolitica]|nr:Uncharacterised protein [Yersinia enterocolitica]